MIVLDIKDNADHQFILDLVEELGRARAKFPSPDHLTLALAEEAGETIKAVCDSPWRDVRKEAIQTAAMALRLAVEGDPTQLARRLGKGLDCPPHFSQNTSTQSTSDWSAQ